MLVLTRACTSTRIGRDPSTQHSTADPGVPDARSERNNFDGLATGRRPVSGHFENAELADRAKSILHSADHAMRVMTLALEIQHGINDVLEHLGARQTSVLRDVTHQNVGTF